MLRPRVSTPEAIALSLLALDVKVVHTIHLQILGNLQILQDSILPKQQNGSQWRGWGQRGQKRQ